MDMTIWPYPCLHSLCKTCHQKSFLNGHYRCPECRSPPLCRFALFLDHHISIGNQLPPGAMQRLYDIANRPDQHPLEMSQLPPRAQMVVSIPHPTSPPHHNLQTPTMESLASSALEIINTQFIQQQVSQAPSTSPAPQFNPLPHTSENPTAAMITTMANELINSELHLHRSTR